MTRIRLLLVAGLLAIAAALPAAPAHAVVCHDDDGGLFHNCCEDVEVLGKTILQIDCTQ